MSTIDTRELEVGRTIDELAVGDTATFSKTISEYDVYAFAGITGDQNPVHIDRVAAEASPFGARVAHGMLTASLLSTVLGLRLPGPGTIYLSQNLRFLKPVYIGDTVTARVEVVELNREKNRVRLATRCTNERGEVVAEGESVVLPPKARMQTTGGTT
jgi:3-hydroxybutyryl-CoA dehydratase